MSASHAPCPSGTEGTQRCNYGRLCAVLTSAGRDVAAVMIAEGLARQNGDDLRRDPLEVRKATLRSMLAKAGLGIRFNEHLEGDGPTVFGHACKMGLEGIVSKRLGSYYRSGRTRDWLKFKNPDAPAVKREAEEDWG